MFAALQDTYNPYQHKQWKTQMWQTTQTHTRYTQPIPMQTMKNTNMTVMTLHTQAHACKHIDVLYSLNFRIHRIVKIRSGMHEIRSELKHTRPNLHSANWLSNLLYECTTHKAYPIKPHSTIALSLLAFLIQLTENYCDNMKVSEWIFANKTL